MKGRAKEPQLRQERKLGERRGIMHRKEAEGLEVGGCPGDTLLLSHQRGGEGERVGKQEVRPFRRRQGVFVGLPEDRHHELTDDKLAPGTPVHAAPNEFRVSLGVGKVGPHSPEADAQRLDLLPVGAVRGDHGLMPAFLQAKGHGDVGVQVAQGAERRQDDPPPGLPRVGLVCRSECSHACPRSVASGQGEPKSSLVPPEPRVRVSAACGLSLHGHPPHGAAPAAHKRIVSASREEYPIFRTSRVAFLRIPCELPVQPS